jgi:hypothetical protein
MTTALLDIAALAVLLLALTFVPVLWMRQEAKITRQIRAARDREDAVHRPPGPSQPAALRRLQSRLEPARRVQALHQR